MLDRLPQHAAFRYKRRPLLGFTYHAGEDFRLPSTGLRAVAEVVENFELKHGDRLGHALVLGIDYQDWLQQRLHKDESYRRRQDSDAWCLQVRMPRGVYLADLIWERRFWQRTPFRGGNDGQNEAHQQRLGWLDMAITDLANRLSGTPPLAERLLGYYEARDAHIHLPLEAYHFHDPNKIDPRDQEWIDIDTKHLQAWERLRDRLCRDVRQQGIVIETCPQSNLAIADLPHDADPPAIALLNKGQPCSIGSDDPLLFGGRLLDEYALLQQKNCSDEALQRLAATSAKSAFIRARQ